MIQENKQRWAIQIVQDLIIKARSFAYERKDAQFMAEFLDRVELFPV